MRNTVHQCKLCGNCFSEEEMSDEHYPARSVGNDDVVALDLLKLLDMFQDEAVFDDAIKYTNPTKTYTENIDAILLVKTVISKRANSSNSMQKM